LFIRYAAGFSSEFRREATAFAQSTLALPRPAHLPNPIASAQPADVPNLKQRDSHVAIPAYVRAKEYDNPNFEKYHARVKSDRSWRTYEMPCGHEVMIDMRGAQRGVLLEAS
jgi:hypothetical protein